MVTNSTWWWLELLTFIFGGVDKYIAVWELRGPRTYIKTENGQTRERYQYLQVKLIQDEKSYHFTVGEQNIKTPDITFKSLTRAVLTALNNNGFSVHE